MVLIRQDTKSLLIFPPKILDVFESVPVAKNLSNIIRATYLIEQAVTRFSVFAPNVSTVVGTNVTVKAVFNKCFNDAMNIYVTVCGKVTVFIEIGYIKGANCTMTQKENLRLLLLAKL